MNLILETKEQPNKSPMKNQAGHLIMMTPPISEDYWLYRVAVGDNQAIIGFPKFNVIGIGFQIEEDWNTNLPKSEGAEAILNHIWHNRGKGNDGPEFRERCLQAIRMIQTAAK